MTDTFWRAIDAQIKQLRTAASADDVLDTLKVEGHNSPAFFAGSGGDDTMYDALIAAGWDVVWFEAIYHWCMKAPDGSFITYVEGDIFPIHDRPLPHNERED